MIYLIALLLLISFYFVAYKSRPAANAKGDAIGENISNTRKNNDELIIGTYNVQSGKSADGVRDINRAAEVVKNCDIVAIQEVYGKPWFGKHSQIEQLAIPNNMASLFAPTRRRWMRDHRGNGLLSKVQLTNWSYTQLPDITGKQYRNFIRTFVDLNGVQVAIIATHLHTRKGREEQLKFVIDEFLKHDHAVLLGDLNTKKTDPQIKSLLERADISDVIALSEEFDSENRIDWALTKNLKAHPKHFIPIGISDHPFYSISIKLP